MKGARIHMEVGSLVRFTKHVDLIETLILPELCTEMPVVPLELHDCV